MCCAADFGRRDLILQKKLKSSGVLRALKPYWRHIVALTLLVVAAGIHWFVAGKAAWWNVPGSVPPPMMAVVPIGVALLAVGARRKLYFFLYAILLFALIAPRLDINVQALFTAKAEETSGIKVMGWNTYLWDQHDEDNDMYAFMKSHNQDIYILQEYEYSENWKPYLIDRYDDIATNFPDYNIATIHEYVIISKYPIESYSLSESKQSMVARVLVDGKPLTIINVHLRPHVDLGHSLISPKFWRYVDERHELRQRGYREIERLVAEESGNGVIVTGDFNTTVLMGGLDGLRAVLDDAVTASRELVPVTWKRTDGRYLWRIDQFMHNRHIDVLSYETVIDDRLSDHKAMLVKLQMR